MATVDVYGVTVPDKLMTVAEAAEVLGMGRSTLYRLVQDHSVPHRRMPTGVVRFTPADIEQMLADAHRPPIQRSRRRLNVAG